MNIRHKLSKLISLTLTFLMAFTMFSVPTETISAANTQTMKIPGLDKGQVAYPISDFKEFDQFIKDWEKWNLSFGQTIGTVPVLEPVGVLTRDIEFSSSHKAYDDFSGEIRGDGHIIYAPTVVFNNVSDALFINIQFSVKRTSSASYSSRGLANALIALNAYNSTFINCFSTDTLVPMISHESGCSFINCYTQYRTNPNSDTDPIGIPYLPDAQMRTQAFAYILNNPEIYDKDLAKKVEQKYTYQSNSVPIPIKKTPTSSVKEITKEPLDYKDSAYQIKNSSDLLSLSILTKLGLLKTTMKDELFVQSQNIKMSEKANKGFVPIGTKDCPFSSTYDGQGFMISNLESNGGLFNHTDNAKIVNVALEKVNIHPNSTYNGIEENGNIYTGALINAANNTTIDRCYVTGTVSGKYAGGMIGFSNYMTMSNCYTLANISTSGIQRAGGLTGYDFKGDYKNVYVARPFKRANRMGGLFGYLFAPYSIYNCYYNQGSNSSPDEENYAYESGDINNVNAISKPTEKMQTNLFAQDLNSDPIDQAFGWKASANEKFPVLYGVGVGTGVVPPKDLTVTLKQPKGATITIKYNGEEYKKDGTKLNIAEGTEIELSYEEDYTYKFVNYTAKVGKGTIKKFETNKFVVTDNTEISGEVKKNGATITFSYDKNAGSVEYDAEQGVKGDTVTVEKGDAFEFEIFPEYGYRIKKVTYTAGNIHKISDTRYKIQRVAKDGTVKIEFTNIEKEEIKDVVDEETGDVIVKVNKQTDLLDQIAINKGNKLQVEMGKATMLSGKVLNELYGEDVKIELVMKNYKWTIDGKTVNRTRNRNINMGVEIGNSKIKLSDIAAAQLANHKDVIPIVLKHRGDYPFTGYLTLNMKPEQQYRYANLFHYNPKSKVFEFQECNDIADNGDITFRFSKAGGLYAIVIEDEPIWDLAAGEGMTETEIPLC